MERVRRLSSIALRWVLLWCCLGAMPAYAQETTGTITGVVTDQTGAVLPGTTVVAKQVQTGRTHDVVTNDSGRYTVPVLEPGTYELTFSLSGFQSVTVTAVELHVNDRLTVDGKLGTAALSESVTVNAASQFVQRTPAVQNLIGPTQVQELPLNNRNFVQLATLVPGVSSDLGDEVGVGLTSTVSISVNGGRRNAVNWLVDGVSNVDVGSNVTLLSTPTLESIQEFKIITSSYQAEWPRSGGGIVNVVTKSGSSKFTGSAYEFFRNDKLNANSYFRNLSSDATVNSKPPDLSYNNFGATIGGPLLPSRQKAFFFFSEEWRRIRRAVDRYDSERGRPGVAHRSDQRQLRAAGAARSQRGEDARALARAHGRKQPVPEHGAEHQQHASGSRSRRLRPERSLEADRALHPRSQPDVRARRPLHEHRAARHLGHAHQTCPGRSRRWNCGRPGAPCSTS